MIYNPIFEEEKERKLQFKQLKKEIKRRAREEHLRQTITRVYHLLQRKPILTLSALFHPVVNLFRSSKDEESVVSKT